MKKLFLLLFTAILSLTIISCDELFNNNDNPDDAGSNITKEFSTDQGGTLKADNGSEIQVPTGAVTKNKDGKTGKIIFTIEPSVPTSELPSPIPSNFALVGNVHHFGPSHFTFQYALFVHLPASTLANLEGVYVVWYNEQESKWVTIPISDIDATNKRLGVAVFELGYFAVVKDKNVPAGKVKGDEIQEYHKSGGIKITHLEGGNYYTLLITGFQPKYTEDAIYSYSNYTSGTGSKVTGGPADATYMVGLRPGLYTVVVSRHKAGTFTSSPGPEQFYSLPVNVNVGSFTNPISWSIADNEPWSTLSLTGGSWQSGFPTIWPNASTSLGTGELQLTLNWTNTESRIYTVDIFVYGPNDQYVSWHSPYSSDGTFALDRYSDDNNIGYASRNVYSINKMPSGTYKVYVNIWDKHQGDGAMPFELRVIRKGKFEKLIRQSISTENNDEVLDKMLKVYEFSL